MKILIVKTSSRGDVVHCFPVINYIKALHPEARIDWVVEQPFAALLEAHPHIHKVHIIDTKKWRKNIVSSYSAYRAFCLKLDTYDILFDFQGNTKSAFFTWSARAKIKVGFGRENVTEWPNLLVTNRKFDPPPGQNIRDDYLFLAQSLFNDFTTPVSQQIALKTTPVSFDFPRPMILVCPGSAWPNKQLTEETLKDMLKNMQGSFLYVYGNEEEKRLVENLQHQVGGHVLEKGSLPQLQAIMSQMDLVIAMDSLALHLAGTTHTPTFSVFGPSLGKKYYPIGPQHTFYQGSCPYGRTFEKRCPILRSCPSGACMHDISGKTLADSIL